MPHSNDPEKVEARHLAAALQRFGQFSGKNMLDVGCGDGSFTREYAACLPYHVFGIDPGLENLQKAKSGPITSVSPFTFTAAKGEALPFPDGSFDVAALTSSF
jgi:ubiquinone/menaquinone biosynthesis C-methylase UbiE